MARLQSSRNWAAANAFRSLHGNHRWVELRKLNIDLSRRALFRLEAINRLEGFAKSTLERSIPCKDQFFVVQFLQLFCALYLRNFAKSYFTWWIPLFVMGKYNNWSDLYILNTDNLMIYQGMQRIANRWSFFTRKLAICLCLHAWNKNLNFKFILFLKTIPLCINK